MSFSGKAQERTSVFRTGRRRTEQTGPAYTGPVRSTAMVLPNIPNLPVYNLLGTPDASNQSHHDPAAAVMVPDDSSDEGGNATTFSSTPSFFIL